MVGVSEPLQDQIAQAAAYGIADKQSPRENCNGRRHAKHDGGVRAPIVREVATDERAAFHHDFRVRCLPES